MSMDNAMRFLDSVRRDPAFRGRLYDYRDGSEFRSGLDRLGFVFSDAEIEDALRALELRSSDEESAVEIREIGNWFFMLALSDQGRRPAGCAGCRGAR